MGKNQPARPAKNSNILTICRQAVSEGNYTPVDHAKLRFDQREITIQEMEQVIRLGYHEKTKDIYKPEYKTWNYSIRGKTIDKKDLRIVVSLDKASGLLIITVIDLGK